MLVLLTEPVQKLECTYYGEVSDYTRKGGVVLAEIHLPQQAPERFKDRETLWNEVEWIEGNKKSTAGTQALILP